MTRRGSVYILVLLTSAFVLATGLAALQFEQRAHARTGINSRVAAARFAARTGMDLALQLMAENKDWRDSVNSATDLYLTREIDSGEQSFTVRVYTQDADGDINDGDLDPFTLFVVASSADTRRTLRVDLQPTLHAVDILEVGAYSLSGVQTNTSSSVTGNIGIASAGAFKGTGSMFFVSVETEQDRVESATYASTVTLNATPREFVPDDQIGDLYTPYGTVISSSNLNYDGSSYTIDRMAIGPGRNPFGLLGLLSPDDVYIIQHGSRDVIIRNSRIIGTLVFQGSGRVIIEQSVNWSPATPGWPTIINDESETVFRMSSSSLSEAGQYINYNPVGMGSGSEDLDMADFYTSQIGGIVYCRNDVTVETGVAKIVGNLVCRGQLAITATAVLELRSDPTSLDSPPPGFESVDSPSMVIAEWLDP